MSPSEGRRHNRPHSRKPHDRHRVLQNLPTHTAFRTRPHRPVVPEGCPALPLPASSPAPAPAYREQRPPTKALHQHYHPLYTTLERGKPQPYCRPWPATKATYRCAVKPTHRPSLPCFAKIKEKLDSRHAKPYFLRHKLTLFPKKPLHRRLPLRANGLPGSIRRPNRTKAEQYRLHRNRLSFLLPQPVHRENCNRRPSTADRCTRQHTKPRLPVENQHPRQENPASTEGRDHRAELTRCRLPPTS